MQLTDRRSSRRQAPIRIQGDLFVPDALSTWFDSPLLAFEMWLGANGRFRRSTRTVYLAMFGKFVAWLGDRHKTLRDCDAGDLRDFLDAQALEKHHRHRYVRLIERVFDHLTALGYRGANPGRVAASSRIGAGENDPTRFLFGDERDAVIDLVEESGRRSDERGDPREGDWVRLRDRALVAVMMGAGVKVNEIQRLTLDCVADDGWIEVPGSAGDRPAHRTRLLPFAREVVKAWLAVRRTLPLAGTALFPPTPRGRRPGRKGSADRMHATSIFRRAQAVLGEAGVDAHVFVAARGKAGSNRACAQTLRNTFAALLFEQQAPDELVSQHMGLARQHSVQRLRAAFEIACRAARERADDDDAREAATPGGSAASRTGARKNVSPRP